MALPKSICDRENDKFKETPSGETSVRFNPDNSYILELAKGNIPGHSAVLVTGHSQTISNSSSVFGQIGVTTYTFPTVASTISIVSTSPNDTASGTGAQSILVNGLNDSYVQNALETIPLNGTTPVTTTGIFFRQNFMSVATAGSTGSPEGVITASISGSPVRVITIGHIKNQDAVYTVPTGHRLFVTSIEALINETKTIQVDILRGNASTGVFGLTAPLEIVGGNAAVVQPPSSFFPVSSEDDLEVRVNTNTGGADGTFILTGILVQDGF